MSSLTPRPGRSPASRRSREKRAYQLGVAGATAGVVAVVGAILAVVGVVGAGLPLLAAVIAAVCALLFRRTVS